MNKHDIMIYEHIHIFNDLVVNIKNLVEEWIDNKQKISSIEFIHYVILNFIMDGNSYDKNTHNYNVIMIVLMMNDIQHKMILTCQLSTS